MKKLICISSVINLEKNRYYRTTHTPTIHQQSPQPLLKPITNRKPQHTTIAKIKSTTSTTTKSDQPTTKNHKKKKKKYETHEAKRCHRGGYSTFETHNQSQTTTHNHCQNQINHLYHNKIRSTHNPTIKLHRRRASLATQINNHRDQQRSESKIEVRDLIWEIGVGDQ